MAYQNNNAMQKVQQFKGLINTKDMVRRMTTACGGKEAAGQFMASMLDLYEGDNYLQNCDPQKVLMECLKAASLNLPLIKSLGYAYVVPYKNTPTFIIGYRGLIQLALRSGQYRILNADCIYEGEDVSFNRITGHISVSGTKTSDKAVGFFAYFQLTNGFEKSFYMTREQVDAYARKYSKSYNSSASPWKTEFDAMAKKTVIRQILKYGPMSTEMQEAERLEIQGAEQMAQLDVQRNANQGPVVDIPVQDAEFVQVDESTGEVVGQPPQPTDAPPFDAPPADNFPYDQPDF